ncbi:hypothetical protein C8R44DRAFT_945641 [Mycena epipterygia]|nr:hypothetical protein C8R44DRAFT_945641 [Mycena epipterygia]
MDPNDTVAEEVQETRLQLSVVPRIQSCQSDGCTLDADVLLRSSDGVIYEAHSKNLEIYSGGFPPSNFATGSDKREVVQVTEPSSVLALLLQYVHNQRQPDSSQFEFKTLAGLAEAAEKYMVYSAMEILGFDSSSISTHPLPVLAYATKHGYSKLRDAAAPGTISTSFENVAYVLQDMPDALIAWVKYREGFIHALHFLFKRPPVVLHRGGLETCAMWATFQKEIFAYFEAGLGALGRIREFSACVEAELHHLKDCTHCTKRARAWANSVSNRVDSLPPFHAFLLPAV